MTTPDLDKDVYIVCSCEGTCRKDDHALNEGSRCSVWITRRHLCTVAATTLRRIKWEAANDS